MCVNADVEGWFVDVDVDVYGDVTVCIYGWFVDVCVDVNV